MSATITVLSLSLSLSAVCRRVKIVRVLSIWAHVMLRATLHARCSSQSIKQLGYIQDVVHETDYGIDSVSISLYNQPICWSTCKPLSICISVSKRHTKHHWKPQPSLCSTGCFILVVAFQTTRSWPSSLYHRLLLVPYLYRNRTSAGEREVGQKSINLLNLAITNIYARYLINPFQTSYVSLIYNIPPSTSANSLNDYI